MLGDVTISKHSCCSCEYIYITAYSRNLFFHNQICGFLRPFEVRILSFYNNCCQATKRKPDMLHITDKLYHRKLYPIYHVNQTHNMIANYCNGKCKSNYHWHTIWATINAQQFTSIT